MGPAVHVLSFDTETSLIRPALLAPPMTCLTWQRRGHEPRIDHVFDAEPRLRSWLTDTSTLLVGHHTAFDAAVICAEFPDLVPLVFKAYRENRVTCTMLRQKLLDIAGGVYRGRTTEKGFFVVHNYDLAALASRMAGIKLQKDGWRLQYAAFRDVPLTRWTERAQEIQARAALRRAELPPPAEVAAWIKGLKKSAGTDAAKAAEREIADLDALIADVPEGAVRYPLEDARATLAVYEAQEKHAEYLKDQYRQAYAYFVLYLSSAWGLRTYGPGVEALKAELYESYKELEGDLVALGMVRGEGKQAGSRDMKAVKRLMIDTCKEKGLPIRRTEGHTPRGEPPCPFGDACEEHVSLDADACEAAISGDGAIDADGNPLDSFETPLGKYSEFVTLGKMLNNDVEMLEAGITYPVHTRYDLAETGRTTSSKPNIQNLNTGRIKNDKSHAQRLRPGVRQAFIPRPGKVFIQADFPQLELYTLAQCCYSWLGHSALGDTLNAGLDPHLIVAAKICGISYEEAAANKERHDVDHARQVGKVFNFGKPGGLGTAKLILYARKSYGVKLTREQCEAYTAQWHEAFPEMRQYFARVNSFFGDGIECASVVTLFTERHRGGTRYCSACNNGFQGLGSDIFKCAFCLVAEAEYCDPSSPLYGSRAVAGVHDEIISETDDGPGVHDAAFEQARLMTVGAKRYLPDVPIQPSKMKPVAMRVWAKGAKQVFDAEGRLVPWQP